VHDKTVARMKRSAIRGAFPGFRPMAFIRATLCIGLISSALAAAPDSALEARVNKLSEELRCLVCQNQSIAESQAELAQDLRRQVREMLAAGKSDDAVREFMVERYGDFVLYDPPVERKTWLLWAGPLLLAMLALGALLLRLRGRNKLPADAEVTVNAAALAQARALLALAPPSTGSGQAEPSPDAGEGSAERRAAAVGKLTKDKP
jgi:cytochrome c-type biogenesis protein CcmH